MKHPGATRKTNVVLVLITLLFSLYQAQAQTSRKSLAGGASLVGAKRRTPAPALSTKATAQRQIELLMERVDELDRKLKTRSSSELETDSLHRIEELEKRLAETEKRLFIAEQLVAKMESSPDSKESIALHTVNSEADASIEPQRIGAPQRIDVPEPSSVQDPSASRPVSANQQRLRWYGDFRLRADTILRPALTDPPPGQPQLPHEQNARARYRLRLNFDADISPQLNFHGQLSTGRLNDPLDAEQDFTAITARHPISISEAWIEYRPTRSLQLQGGRVLNVFADNSRFLFDDDVRFNGFNQRYSGSLKPNRAYLSSIEIRAGQYFFTNPNIAVVTPGSPLAQAGAVVGSTARASNLFHQGALFNQTYNDKVNGQFGFDLQLFRNPNQIQLASTPAGLPILVQDGLGITLSGPLTGVGTATTTPGGATYTAPDFKILRLTYRINWNKSPKLPISFNLQVARNVGIELKERDALLASIGFGSPRKSRDQSVIYVFTIKGANSLISQLTDSDLGTGSGTNVRVHLVRYTLALSRNVFFQSNFFMQNEIRNSDPSANFFVPLNAFTPRQYRFQQQLLFAF